MKFFERFPNASARLINQLWQNDYINTESRNVTMNLILQPISAKNWLERIFLVLGLLFITASVLLFFAFNWAHIPPFVKLGSILALILLLACFNSVLLHQNKEFSASLILTANSFIVGVFMAVFGQIYQTGADSYTLFLTWAIMILPWVLMAKFNPLWLLWLVVMNLAIVTWWDLETYPEPIKYRYLFVLLAMVHLALYAVAMVVINKGQKWLNVQGMKVVLSFIVFVTTAFYIGETIIEYRAKYIDIGFWICLTIFMGFYAYSKWISKSIHEYSIGFISAAILIVILLTKLTWEYLVTGDTYVIAFALNAGLVILFFKYAYQYYNYVTADFKETF